jgi:NADH-quinone oxidoreductase E subunit
MPVTFSDKTKQKIEDLLKKYPTRQAVTLPALWLAQEEFGHISPEVSELVAATLGVAPSHVHGVATFYTMYNKKPVGRLHIQVCTNVACMICGAYDLLSAFEQRCGIKAGQTNEDFTLQEVECLAACGTAPAVQINDKYYEPVYPKDVPALVDRLLAEAKAPKTDPAGKR